MKKELLKYISKFPTLIEQEVKDIVKNLTVGAFPLQSLTQIFKSKHKKLILTSKT